jgi:signal transduction histidine kinase
MTSVPRWLRDRRVALCVVVGTFAWVAAVYVVIVVGGGLLIGHTDSPELGLSVLATAVVALGFEPVRSRLEGVATQWVGHGRGSPYDALSRFSDSVLGDGDGDAPADLPLRMAQVLAEGTGARWTQVWLVVDDVPQLAASWPPDADDAATSLPASGSADARVRSLDVLLAGERLGMLRLQEHDDQPLTPVEERLFSGLAAQAGLVLRRSRLRAELSRRAEELAVRADELQLSRRRLVDALDAERRRLERDIHDGAQQHLVALVVNLRLAQKVADRSPERAGAVLAQQVEAVDSAIATLVDLSRGIYPRALADEGVAAAVREVVTTSTVPVTVTDSGLGRQAPEVEVALYFCCVEAVQNAVKHAAATRIAVELGFAGDEVTLVVRDDGVGLDPRAVTEGGGLGNMRDRMDSVDGRLLVRRGVSGGTEVLATVPVGRRAEVV